ncbi:MAG: D-glycero-beta-D-manno-heptose-7-phosphate kinase [Rhodospirillales bacterium]|nr:D-glycero-beta-D-manno-heptose-7-phosphate kinase [Rhodospirillales bacterium]
MTDNSPLDPLIEKLADGRVLCIGDVMLDRFISGTVDRISPEAPIPILRIEDEKTMLGGAGNVACNISSLGGEVSFISVVGEDPAGLDIEALLMAVPGLDVHLIVDPDRSSSQKSRFVAANQQMLRADSETTQTVSDDVAGIILEIAAEELPDCGALMLSDYGKGVLSDAVLASLIEMARAQNKPVIVDPKGHDYSCYAGATLVTPNRKELEQASGRPTGSDQEIIAAANLLIERSGVDGVLATRSGDGMTLIQSGQPVAHFPAEARAVFDVSGAGDTVAATIALCLAAGGDIHAAARLANAAAGLVVGKAGTATVPIQELITSLAAHPVLDDASALRQAEAWRASGLRIGFTNGCFDILHNGHRSLLQQAGDACDRLIVAVNTDASVRKLKGDDRPLNNEMDRAVLLSSLKMVDAVILFGDETPLRLIETLKPDVLIKGADYQENEIVGAELVKSWGGAVVRARLVDGLSTTNTIARMREGKG